MCLVSIIVPVYNVDKYIHKCIKSLLNQTLRNIEIILVNDGSTDESGKICDEYSKIDNRIKVIHKINEGLSSARNAGIDIANGEYLGFVDSDDWVDETMYEKLYNNAIKFNASIAQCNILNTYTEYINIDNSREMVNIYSGMEVLEDLYNEKYVKTVVVWNKIYKRELFNLLRFPKGKLHEDEFITYKLLHKSEKIVDISNIMYFYRQRSGSIMSSEFNIKRFDIIDAWNEKKEYFKNNNLNILVSKTDSYICGKLKDFYIKVVDSNISDKEYLLKYIKKQMRINYMNFIKNPYISIRGKLTLTLCILNGNIFYKLYYRHFIKDGLYNG